MPTVREAAEAINQTCDGATSEDGIGYNKCDTGFMKDLLQTNSWTPKQEQAAYEVLEKYKEQLKRYHGIIYEDLRFTAEKSKSGNNGSTENGNSDNNEKMVLEADNRAGKDRLLLNSEYEFKDKAKAIPNSRWLSSKKKWRYYPKPDTCKQLWAYVEDDVIEPTDRAEEIIKSVLKKEKKKRVREKVAKEIKEGDREPPKDPPPLKNELYDHQRTAFGVGISLRHSALLMEQGTGKTLAAIAVAGRRYLDNHIKRMLVIAPTSVTTVWEEEFHKHADFPYRVEVLYGMRVDKRKEILNNWEDTKGLQVAVINYEVDWRMDEELEDWGPDMIVLDESQRIKNHKAKQSKAAHDLGKQADYRMILTGTPVTKNPIDFFSQYKFLDPHLFGESYYKFRERYAIMGGYGGYQIVDYQNLDELSDKVHRKAYRITKDEALDLPDTVDQNMYCELHDDAERYYNKLEKEFIVKLGEEGIVTAPIVLTKLLRLQQLVGGFVPTEDDEIKEVQSGKLELMKEFLDDYPEDKKLVVFARFLPEINAIKNIAEEHDYTAKVITGKTKQRDKVISNFQNKEDPQVLVLQIQTGGLGITLTNTDTVIFYSTTFSYGDYDQAKARVHRIGQNDTVNYIHFITRDTIDKHIMEAVQEKKDLADIVVDRYFEESPKPNQKGEEEMSYDKREYQPERGVKFDAIEDKELLKRLKKLQEEAEAGEIKTDGLEEIQKEHQKKIDKANEQEGITPGITEEEKKKNGKGSKGKKKSKKKKKDRQEVDLENIDLDDYDKITPKVLSEIVNLAPTTIRKKLRKMEIEKPGSRWSWPTDHEDIPQILEHLLS